MKTYPLYDKYHRLHAFEINNFWIGRKRAVRIAESIPDVTILQYPKPLFSWFKEALFCVFEVNGVHFHIEEPFGDNSRYWIGQAECGGYCDELLIVEETFKKA